MRKIARGAAMMAAVALAAVAAGAGAQPPFSEREAAALAVLARGEVINPTKVSVAAARAAVRARPRDADAWHQLGESLGVAGDLPGAVAAFERASRLPPRIIGRAFLYRDLADARERAGDYEGALAAARVSVRSWPLSQHRLFCAGTEVRMLTRLLIATHREAEAIAFYTPIYEADPQRPECRAIIAAVAGD